MSVQRALSALLLVPVVQAAAGAAVAPAEDRCAALGDVFNSHYNIECIWCKSADGHGRCANWTSTPRKGETCDSLEGCGGHRTQNVCDGDGGCKWCQSISQGWPFCTKASDNLTGSATCDKDLQEDRCAAAGNEFACHYDIECIWCRGDGGKGRCASWTSKPRAGETCDSLQGCSGHRTQPICNGDSKCKWCHTVTQGWPFCANVTDDVHGSSTCDKPSPSQDFVL
uniref:Uncharacterized protein n=1 Tax=Pfiesteria piscicida TaxID=71001 RepID=A3E3W6_PFIPI|nr:unknown [Pfiesteria piscicida]